MADTAAAARIRVHQLRCSVPPIALRTFHLLQVDLELKEWVEGATAFSLAVEVAGRALLRLDLTCQGGR